MSNAAASAVLSSILRSRLNQNIAIGVWSWDGVGTCSVLILDTIVLIGKNDRYRYRALGPNKIGTLNKLVFLSCMVNMGLYNFMDVLKIFSMEENRFPLAF